MFFRFAAGLLLVVLVSMAGVRLEKQTLEIRRMVSVQYYQTDLLLELLVRLRLQTQQLTAPAQLALTIENAAASKSADGNTRTRSVLRLAEKHGSDEHRSDGSGPPLLRFQQLFNPEGID